MEYVCIMSMKSQCSIGTSSTHQSFLWINELLHLYLHVQRGISQVCLVHGTGPLRWHNHGAVFCGATWHLQGAPILPGEDNHRPSKHPRKRLIIAK